MLRRCAVSGLLGALLLLTAGPATAAVLLPGENALVSIPSGFGGLPSADVNDSYVWSEGVSDDGCRIAFRSTADGLVADDDDRFHGVYVRDRCAPTPTTTLVSRGTGAGGAAANGTSSGAAVSADGTLVAFSSSATNLTMLSANPTADVNGAGDDIFVRDLSTNTTYFVSRLAGLNGAATAAFIDSLPSVTRAAGDILVTFDSYTDLLVPGDTNGTRDVFLRNVTDGTIVRVNVKDATAATQANGFSRNGAISENGQWVAFDSNSTDMNALDATSSRDIYVRNVAGTNATLLASHTAANAPSSGGDSINPAIDATGTDVAWSTYATNFSAADTNARNDVYAATRVATFGAATLISRADGAAGAVGDESSIEASIDDAGARVAFQSQASNLAPGDANARSDVFVRVRASSDTYLLSGSGAAGDVPARGEVPAISGDGLRVAFGHSGSDLSPDADSSARSILVRTVGPPPSAPELVSRPTGSDPFQSGLNQSFFRETPIISPDGRFVAFNSASPALLTGPGDRIFLRDTLLGVTTHVSRADGAGGAPAEPDSFSIVKSVSDDGTKVAFFSDARNLVADDTNGRQDLFVRDLTAGTTTRIGRKSDGTFPGGDYDSRATLSGDGRRIVFETSEDLLPEDTGTDGDVYLQELASGALSLVSRGAGAGPQAPDGGYGATIDGDGSRVAFGTASDLAPPGADPNTDGDVYIRELATGELILVSRPDGATSPTVPGNSYEPVLSHDGNAVVFQSSANLTGSGGSHLYARDVAAGSTKLVDRADGTAGAPADEGGYYPTLSADGTRVGFLSSSDNLGAGDQTRSQGYVRDLAASTTSLVTRATGAGGDIASLGANDFQISAQANCAVFGSASPGLLPGLTQQDFAVIYLRGLSRECPADPPDTSITSGPSGLTKERSPAFGLAAGEAATFTCRIDGGTAASCASGFRPAALGDGGHTLSATATDAAGYVDATPAMRTFSVDGTAPLITKLAASPKRFAVRTLRRRAKRSKTAKLGTSIGFRLSEPAAATVTVLRELPGRKSGKRCVALRKGARPPKRSARCTRSVTVGVVKLAKARVGTNTVKLTRRVGKGTLAPGAHRITVDARDGAGNDARRRTVRVTVLAPRRPR